MRVAIVGSRLGGAPTEVLREARAQVTAYVLALPPEDDIATGDAHGVDEWARDTAWRHRILVVVRPAWFRNGKAAGPLRNRTIADIADRMVAFWDGKSSGTKSAIDAMRALGKPVEIVSVGVRP